MDWHFVKSHGLGNDYLVADAARIGFDLTPGRVREICHRHTGVGSDGILLLTDRDPVFCLKIFNPDGSEAEKSGNGLRIFAKFLFEHGYTDREEFPVQTAGGKVQATLTLEEGVVRQVRVAMGAAVIDRSLKEIEVAGAKRPVTSLSLGNPHCVLVLEALSLPDLLRLGPLIERHEAFPNRTNVQFARVASRHQVEALIWERGAGHTLASGSSSCAVAVACVDRGLVDSPVTVAMEGGQLRIEVDAARQVIMTGPAEETARIRLSDELHRRILKISE